MPETGEEWVARDAPASKQCCLIQPRLHMPNSVRLQRKAAGRSCVLCLCVSP